MSLTTKTKTLIKAFFITVCCSSATSMAAEQQAQLLQQLANSHQRSAQHIARNEFRKPVATLQFFGIEPNMSVLEIWPGHGWYTEILAPYLKEQGQLTLAQFRHNDGTLKDERSIFWAKVSERLAQRLADNSDYFGSPALIELEPPLFSPAVTEQFDLVLTFRNAHIWNESGHLFATLQSLFQALKPGGVLGMVEHRAARLSDISSSAVEGYLDEAYVIEVAERAGFKLLQTSEINANPKDTKDYPKGVYALPPTLAMGQDDRQKYLAIGESDRMTLKFIKPHQH
ncbi:MAG: methyltransferase [Chromatiaceae bacterium]|nr:methyltransferase [Chromatiaceae bacterium]